MGFSKDVLKLDCAKETDRIAAKMREALVKMKKRGLVVAMSGTGPGFVTDVPGIYIYDYLGSRYDQASAMAVLLLVLTLFVVVPYLMRSYRSEKRG